MRLARHLHLFVFLLLASMAGFEILSMLKENSTADETIHLVTGYSCLRYRAFGLNAEHPPLAKVLCAMPLLFLNLDLPTNFRATETEEGELGRQFLYHNRVPADQMLNMARGVTVVFSLLLGLAIALFSERHFGPKAGVLALALFCFDPNFIAHGHYVTTDLVASLSFFVACIAWIGYLERPGPRSLTIAGLCAGLAIVSKFSLLILPIVFILMYTVKRFTTLTRVSSLRLLKAFLAITLISGVVIYMTYGFETVLPISDKWVSEYFDKTPERLRGDPIIPRPVIRWIDASTLTGRTSQWIVRNVPIPAFSFFKGIYRLYNHAYWGHDSYLLGNYSRKGRWFYFPVAIAVKTPVATLTLLIVAMAILIWRRRSVSEWPQVLLLLIPPAVYLLFSLASTINIGIRHILPIYPFLFVVIGAVVTQFRIGRVAALAFVLLLMIESSSSYPNYLPFFNFAAGGSQNGPRYLIDSNIDWGQDLKKLKEYMDRNSIPDVCLRYFGSGESHYYGITHHDLPVYPAPASCRVAAVSVNELYFKDSKLKPLLACQPRARIGYSIYVYDLRNGECAVKATQ